jgi:hypothetical protein
MEEARELPYCKAVASSKDMGEVRLDGASKYYV